MPDARFLQHFSPSNPAAGQGPYPSEYGFAAWSDNPANCVTSGAVPAAAGTLAMRRFSIPGAMNVTSVVLDIVTGAVGATAGQCFVGVWDSNGVLVGLSADASAAFGTTGLLTFPLVSGAGVPSGPFGVDTPFVYVGFWWNAATSGPFLMRYNAVDAAILNGLASVPAGQARCVNGAVGLTTIATVPAQLGVITKAASVNGAYWCALV